MAAPKHKQSRQPENGHGQPDSDLFYSEIADLTIRRRRDRTGWQYLDAHGKRITDPDEVARLNRIALPPAYTEARFCPDCRGHLQAIGIDARGRRQYRYHPAFREARDTHKFAGCAAFGEALPALRRRLDRDLQANPQSRIAVLAAVVRILDCAFLRIGNQAYARQNKSFGLTTLRNRHARLSRGGLALEYRGKSGIVRKVRLTDSKVIRVVRRCQDLPGQQLFQYRDEHGAVHAISSADVNAYLRDISGAALTAKDLRTDRKSVV